MTNIGSNRPDRSENLSPLIPPADAGNSKPLGISRKTRRYAGDFTHLSGNLDVGDKKTRRMAVNLTGGAVAEPQNSSDKISPTQPRAKLAKIAHDIIPFEGYSQKGGLVTFLNKSNKLNDYMQRLEGECGGIIGIDNQPISREQVSRFINEGQKIFNNLMAKAAKGEPTPTLNSGELCKLWWFFMGVAIADDQSFGRGVIRIAPAEIGGHNIGELLVNSMKSCDGAYPRFSSHFVSKSVGDQYGVDDLHLLDGIALPPPAAGEKMRTMLFGKLDDGGAFVKIEERGFPFKKVIDNPTDIQAVREVSEHSVNYIRHKLSGGEDSPLGTKRETGGKEELYATFKQKLKLAPKISTSQYKTLKEMGKKLGVGRMRNILADLEDQLAVGDILVKYSDMKRSSIERKGEEVIIDFNPYLKKL